MKTAENSLEFTLRRELELLERVVAIEGEEGAPLDPSFQEYVDGIRLCVELLDQENRSEK